MRLQLYMEKDVSDCILFLHPDYCRYENKLFTFAKILLGCLIITG